MYFADSLKYSLYAYDFDPRPAADGPQRVFATTEAPGFPDGSTVDAEGYLWNAQFDAWRVVRYAPDGRIDRVIEMPVQRPTCCAFGGPDLSTLYVTTCSQKMTAADFEAQPLAGALLAIDVGVRGLPEPRFSARHLIEFLQRRGRQGRLTPMQPIQIASIEAFAFRVPVQSPIKVAFGTFRDRPFVLVRITDTEGAHGWGEVWANWPAVGAEHRARLAVDIGERLIGRRFETPQEFFQKLTASLEVLVLQTLEVGPIAQVVAGLDIAMWDLAARRAGVPLHRMLSSREVRSLPVYATGINPDEPERFAADRQAEGHHAFKLKIGFGHERDLRNLRAMREALGPEAIITCDAEPGARPGAGDRLQPLGRGPARSTGTRSRCGSMRPSRLARRSRAPRPRRWPAARISTTASSTPRSAPTCSR